MTPSLFASGRATAPRFIWVPFFVLALAAGPKNLAAEGGHGGFMRPAMHEQALDKAELVVSDG